MMVTGPDYTGFHHADDTALLVGLQKGVPGAPGFDGFYRFLTGHMSGQGHGVAGIEDDDWEATVSSTDHNEYLGFQSSLNTPGGFSSEGHTSTGYCSGCHGNFHVASKYADGIVECPPGSEETLCFDWQGHPVGMVLPSDGDLDFYRYTTYNPNVPLGRPDLSTFTGPSGEVRPGVDAINCLSCHRSHGTPGGSHLRWDPTDWDGCAQCHKTKKKWSQDYYLCDEIDDCNDCHTSHGKSLRYPDDEFGPTENDMLIWMRVEVKFSPIQITVPANTNDTYVQVAQGDIDVFEVGEIIEIRDLTNSQQLTITSVDAVAYQYHFSNDPLLSSYAVGSNLYHVDLKNCTFPITPESPYVSGPPNYNGICEVCHTETLYWRNDGSGAPHYDGPGERDQCLDCHEHTSEFLGEMPDDAVHNVHTQSLPRGPDPMECKECHEHGDTVAEMADAGGCDSCHSPGGIYNGVNDPVVGVKANYAGVYDADGKLKDGKAKWCATCHDWSATGQDLIDDFESYTDDSSLQSVWKGIRDARKATLEPYSDGEKIYTKINGISGQFLGAKILWDKNTLKKNAIIKRTFDPPIDLTGRDYFGFYLKIKHNKIKSVKVKLKKAGGGSCMASIKIKDSGLEKNVWRKVLLHRSDFDDATWGLVSQIKFVFVEKNPTASIGTFVYLDEIGCDLTGPNVVGDNTTWGHYVTGHKMPCEHCHDSSSQHIDYNWRVIFDRVQDPTADNPTKHRFYRDANVTRFYSDATKLDLQLPYTTYIGGQQGSFALCYWCHDESAITTSAKSQLAAQSLITNFRDEDTLALTDEHNMHYLHIVGSPPQVFYGTCALCHDAHGQTKPAMTRTQMEGFIYFDPVGCEIPDILTDSNTNDVPDWHDPDVNMGGARTRWGPRDGRNELCAQDQCHSIDMFDYQQVKHVAPPDPDCADGQHNNYENWSIYGSGYYKRDYSSAVLPDPGTCGEACHGTGP
jgi:predicted CXXCH cytochrome family protein